MKILIIGDFHSEIHEEAIFKALQRLKYPVFKFQWFNYFKNYPNKYILEKGKNIIASFYYRLQYKFALGPVVRELNHDLIHFTQKNQIKYIFIYSGRLVYPQTLKNLKSQGCILIGYNNDDPFSKKYPGYFWRHFINAISFYDHIFSYRIKNILDYEKIKYQQVSILRAYYRKEFNFHIKRMEKSLYSDVLFIGHFENDGRDEYIKEIIDHNINFKLYGSEWESSKYYDYFNKKIGPIDYLYNEKYNYILNHSKIALVFFSKLNNDTYTRRCFEIPAAQIFMLSEYSADLASLFQEGKEAVFFKSKGEMIQNIDYFLRNEPARKKIALAGYKRLVKDKHEVTDRAMEIVKKFQYLSKTRVKDKDFYGK